MGINQTELAGLGHVSLNTQHRYESGGLPSLEYMLRIGEAGADWYWIITGQHINAEPLDSQTAELVKLFQRLPDQFKPIALGQLRILNEQLPSADREILPAADDEQQQATMHDRRQDYRHE